jgi:sugar (pentulose or hexulose) kinase
MFPQYLGYLLTGQKRIEPTYTGCHGYLLDASGTCYSSIADSLGITDKLPDLPFSNPWATLGDLKPEIAKSAGLPANCKVTVGVHDSNAALVPYLSKGLEDFVVQDSGTWVVTMAPKIGGDAEFETRELGREVFYNRSIYGDPVKTNIFRGGAEFDFYRSNVLENKKRPDQVDEELLAEIISQKSAFCLPTIERGSGLFPNSVACLEGVETIFRDHSTAWHVVDLGLAIQGYQALRMAAGENPKHIYIEGNIGKHNPVYRGIIASLFPESEMFYGSMGGAPFGAAILGIAAAENVKPEDVAPRFEMSLNRIERFNKLADTVHEYAATFLEKVK